VDAWTFIWLVVILKIPVVALFLLVRWAVLQTPDATPEQDGGSGPRSRPPQPHHPRSRPPRTPRRGPHGEPSPESPLRVRTIASRRRLPQT